MKKRQSSFTFTSLYIGLVAASLLGILVSVIVVLYQERKEGLKQHQVQQVALQQYLQNAHTDGQFMIDDLFVLFPNIHFLSISNDQKQTLASAAQDRQSLWNSLPNSYQPRAWELAYYTQYISNISIQDNGTLLHLFMVTDLIDRQTVYQLTTWALYAVLLLLAITLIIAMLASRTTQSTPPSEAKTKATPSPTIAYPDNNNFEHDLAQAQEEWLEEPAILQHFEDSATEDLTPKEDLFVKNSSLEPTLDIHEDVFTTLEEPGSFDFVGTEDELELPGDLASFDEELISDETEQAVFMEPADHLDFISDDPQPILFEQDEPLSFQEESFGFENASTNDSKAELNVPEFEGLEMLETNLFDDQSLVDTEDDVAPAAIEDELFNDPTDSEISLEELPLENLEDDVTPAAIDDELFSESISQLEPFAQEELDAMQAIPEEAVALTEYLEDELAKPSETTLLTLQAEQEYSDVFDVLMKNHTRTHFPDSRLACLDAQKQRYALTLAGYDLESSYAVVEDFSNFFAEENLAFSTGLAAKAQREVSADALLQESLEALERAVVSGESGAIMAYKP